MRTSEQLERKRAADRERRRRIKEGGPSDARWVLPDDGVFDEVAVAIAISGERRVRLTRAERLEAVRVCLEDLGLTRTATAARLYVDERTVTRIAAQLAAAEAA